LPTGDHRRSPDAVRAGGDRRPRRPANQRLFAVALVAESTALNAALIGYVDSAPALQLQVAVASAADPETT